MTRAGLLAGLIGATAFAALATRQDAGAPVSARLIITGAVLAAAAVSDLRERRIPNRLTIPAAVALLILWALSGAAFAPVAVGLLIASLLIALALIRPEAIGMGDAKLALVIALGLTDQAFLALASGLLLAAAFAAARLSTRQTSRPSAVPVGPFLALGALLALTV